MRYQTSCRVGSPVLALFDLATDRSFQVWDIDRSLSLTYSELGYILVNGVHPSDLESMTDNFSRVWAEIKSGSGDKDADASSNDHWISSSRAGITKEDLINACRPPGNVRDFFTKMLTKRSPKADENRGNFAARLKELEAEILKESRIEEKKREAEVNAAGQHTQSAPKLSRQPSMLSPMRTPMRKRASTRTLPPGGPSMISMTSGQGSSKALGAPRQLSAYKSQTNERLQTSQNGTHAPVRLPAL